MKIRILLLFLAIIFGVAAVFGVMFYINNIRSKVQTEGTKVEVLVAKLDIAKDTPVHSLLSQQLVAIEEIPQQFVVGGALKSLEGFEGFLVASPISVGEQITAKKFVAPEELGFSLIVPEGMVAISISISEVKGVSNLLNIGDRVNVIATFAPESKQLALMCAGQEPEQVETVSEDGTVIITEKIDAKQVLESDWSVKQDMTKTLLWDVEILYIGVRDRGFKEEEQTVSASTEKEATDTRTVTLALSPEQAEKLVFSDEFGTLRLALLPADGSVQETDTGGMTFQNIFQ